MVHYMKGGDRFKDGKIDERGIGMGQDEYVYNRPRLIHAYSSTCGGDLAVYI